MSINGSRPFSVFAIRESEGPGALRREVLHFSQSVPAASSLVLEKDISRDATVEAIRIRLYPGNQQALQIRLSVSDEKKQVRRSLIATVAGGKDYVDGDDDTFTFFLREPVLAARKEKILVEVTNIDVANQYTFVVDMELDYAGGAFPFMSLVPLEGGER